MTFLELAGEAQGRVALTSLDGILQAKQGNNCKSLTIKWYKDGKAYTDSAGTSNGREAQNKLAARIKEFRHEIVQPGKVTVADLVASYVTSLEVDPPFYARKAAECWRANAF